MRRRLGSSTVFYPKKNKVRERLSRNSVVYARVVTFATAKSNKSALKTYRRDENCRDKRTGKGDENPEVATASGGGDGHEFLRARKLDRQIGYSKNVFGIGFTTTRNKRPPAPNQRVGPVREVSPTGVCVHYSTTTTTAGLHVHTNIREYFSKDGRRYYDIICNTRNIVRGFKK